MELVSLAKEMLQNAAEKAASYRAGQTVLRYLDRGLWVIEKCARWAVPPPLDQEDRPQPELVRPLPWVFFLMLLITLRLIRETISIGNLIVGKPPLRSADVVMYIQSKRRYLRTLKYAGNRVMRARTSSATPRDSWYSGLQSLFDFTMCFRRQSLQYTNNNSRISNNDEVLVVKRSKRGRQSSSPVVSGDTMERLIEKMMVDLDADSDDDSSFTLTNATSPKSERSDESAGSDQETVFQNTTTTPNHKDTDDSQTNDGEIIFSPNQDIVSTPEKQNKTENNSKSKPDTSEHKDATKNSLEMSNPHIAEENGIQNSLESTNSDTSKEKLELTKNSLESSKSDISLSSLEISENNLGSFKSDVSDVSSAEVAEPISDISDIQFSEEAKDSTVFKDAISFEEKSLSKHTVPERKINKEELLNFIQNEKCPQKSQRSSKKIANGRTTNSSNKKKGVQSERKESDIPRARISSKDNSF